MRSTLPAPPNWKQKSRIVTPGLVVVFVGGLCSVYWAVRFCAEKQYPTAVVNASMAVGVFCLIPALAIMHYGWIKTRCVVDVGFIVLRPDPLWGWLFNIGLIAWFLACLGIAILDAEGALAWTLSGRQAGRLEFAGIVCAVLTGVGLVARLRVLFRGRQRCFELSPRSVEFTEWTTFHTAWKDIIEVNSGSEKYRAVVLETRSAGTKPYYLTTQYTPHGRALFWMLHHYWKHPEDRPELADQRAYERLRDENFDTTSQTRDAD